MDEEKKVSLSGVDQVEDGFIEKPESDIQTAAWETVGATRKGMAAGLRAAGVEVPDRPVSEGVTGVDSVQEGFVAQPEMNTVEELDAVKYAAAPQEVDEKIEKVETEYLGDRVKLTEDFLSKLQAGGYTGDLEDLRKIIEEVKGQ